MSRHGDARRRTTAAVLAIGFCIGLAGMVGQGLVFLTKACGVQQSHQLAQRSGELVGSLQQQAALESPAAAAAAAADGAKPERNGSANLVRPVSRRPRLSAGQAFAAVMSARFPYRRTVLRAASRHEVDPALVFAIIASESRGDPEAVSPSGAIGLMQLMPTTAVELGVDPWKPDENIEGAVRYLSSLLDQFKSVDLTLVAYNAGPGFAERYRQGEVDLGAETRAFLMRVAGSSAGALAGVQ